VRIKHAHCGQTSTAKVIRSLICDYQSEGSTDLGRIALKGLLGDALTPVIRLP
jgi:hypothetical protein